MRLALVHVRLQTLELLRYPAYSVPTLVFPAMFFLFSAAPRAHAADAAYFLASFAGFAVVGVAFFQFGVGIAVDRETPWEAYVRTLPLSPSIRLASRVVSAAQFAAASAAFVAVAALATTPVHLSGPRWPQLAAVLVLGIVPFALLGTAIGYLAKPKAALPIANVLYLGLSFAGGLWSGRDPPPHPIDLVAPYLPTAHFANVLRGAVAGDPWRATDWLALAGYAAAFAAVAAFAYRRDEGLRYG